MVQKVRCYECGRSYDYDEDAFCPRCGAFNLPGRDHTVRVGELTEDRRDGLSEKGHSGSFLHQEFHNEERQRRRLGLDREETPPPRQAKQPAPAARSRKREKGRGNPSVAVLIFILLILFQLLRAIF
ncbi:hypothetical protein [Dysosmobacter sp.]|uniref:hypothetical protein n=1 Tax=Dysosmobacter sp. TaxID=2591382 RepID=UPI002A8B41A9|nr:hypothetical protein [Dysosmobacter sp.]MDY3280992.1 hypothetical protein [Dysosmobacter sp.]